MVETYAGFDWDDGNWPKCGKHGVSRAEIEAVITGPVAVRPDVSHSRIETRFLAIGRTSDDRHVLVCFTIRQYHGSRYLRPISARHMHQKEVVSFEKANS